MAYIACCRAFWPLLERTITVVSKEFHPKGCPCCLQGPHVRDPTMAAYLGLVLNSAASIAVAAVVLLVVFSERLIYIPVHPGLNKSHAMTPAILRLDHEEVWLCSSDGVRLHAWFIKLSSDCSGCTPPTTSTSTPGSSGSPPTALTVLL